MGALQYALSQGINPDRAGEFLYYMAGLPQGTDMGQAFSSWAQGIHAQDTTAPGQTNLGATYNANTGTYQSGGTDFNGSTYQPYQDAASRQNALFGQSFTGSNVYNNGGGAGQGGSLQGSGAGNSPAGGGSFYWRNGQGPAPVSNTGATNTGNVGGSTLTRGNPVSGTGTVGGGSTLVPPTTTTTGTGTGVGGSTVTTNPNPTVASPTPYPKDMQTWSGSAQYTPQTQQPQQASGMSQTNPYKVSQGGVNFSVNSPNFGGSTGQQNPYGLSRAYRSGWNF